MGSGEEVVHVCPQWVNWVGRGALHLPAIVLLHRVAPPPIALRGRGGEQAEAFALFHRSIAQRYAASIAEQDFSLRK